MKILQSLLEIEKLDGDYPAVGLTIGNFDGVHSGHRQLLKDIKADCLKNNLLFVLVTFVPHPSKILQPDRERFLISSYEARRKLLSSLGVDVIVEMKFTRDFSTQGARDFLTKHLLTYPSLKKFFLGYDFAFGANKEGDHDLVREICKPYSISVETQPKFELKNQLVSSTYIRKMLELGELEDLEFLLGRSFHLEGVVVRGEGRGKSIGYPTANIKVDPDLVIPRNGVYVTKTIYKGMTYKSVTNIGFNPTFKNEKILNIETNIFDFNNDIYGESIDIEFFKKIRDEKKFSTVNDLIFQIRSDVESSKIFQSQK